MCKKDVTDFVILIVSETGGKCFKSVQPAAANVVGPLILNIFLIKQHYNVKHI